MKVPTQFHFKQFSVWHHRSAMKVGVDGVLIGCWANIGGAHNILDVGTGCGLIALILAQRSDYGKIDGIEIDHASAEEAQQNAQLSPWSERVKIIEDSFPSNLIEGKYDLIISNPPYFNAGLQKITTPREKARHQGSLSPSSIISEARAMLSESGSIAMVIPYDSIDSICRQASEAGFCLWRKCLVKGNPEAPIKRALLQWRIKDNAYQVAEESTILILESQPGIPTEEYRKLCRDFYLKF